MPTRLENLIHYIISVTPPENLGATKLAKIVWFADIEFYRLHGSTVTRADDYQRRDQGPLHADFNRSLAALTREAKISERAVQTPAGARRDFVLRSRNRDCSQRYQYNRADVRQRGQQSQPRRALAQWIQWRAIAGACRRSYLGRSNGRGYGLGGPNRT